jgi:hypothetical protein
VIGVVLLLAVSLFPTRSFGLSENLELVITYFAGGTEVGTMIYNSCFGHMDYGWGQFSGDLKRDRYTYCDTGATSCYWYSWNGSGWVLVFSGDCSSGYEYERPERPRI